MTPNQNSGRRLDGYIRVSQLAGREGDSFHSVDVQEERIRAWATANGHEIIETWHEVDVSGGTMDRPMLNEVMARIDRGETEGVVVFNLSRFARTLKGSVELIERINQRGALFASVSDGFDITTITGRLVLNILLSVAQAERERHTESWQTHKTRAVRRGIHISANVPFGYLRPRGPANPRTGKRPTLPLEVDPEAAAIVQELYRRRAAGEPWGKLRDWLAANDVPTVRGAVWHVSTVQGMIRNKAYLGVAGGSPNELPGGVHAAHPALIDEATWKAAQPRRSLRADTKPSPTMLRGLVRCGSCRYTMIMRRYGKGGVSYLCLATQGCPAPAIISAIGANGQAGLDDAVAEKMWEWEEKRREAIEFEGLDGSLDISEEDRELAELEARRGRDVQDAELERALGREAWVEHLASLTAQIREVEARRDEKLRRLGRPDGRTYAELRADWESGEMSMDDKRAHLASVIQAVFVKPGKTAFAPKKKVSAALRRAKYANRFEIVWADASELVDIPRQGKAGYVIKPWPMDADPEVSGPVLLQPPVIDAGEPVG